MGAKFTAREQKMRQGQKGQDSDRHASTEASKKTAPRTSSKNMLFLVGSLIGFCAGYVAGRADAAAPISPAPGGGGDLARRVADPRALPAAPRSVGAPRGASDACSGRPPRPIPPFKVRGDLRDILQRENMTKGAELGVQTGGFSSHILSKWSQCQEYLLVDLWAPQKNYKDIANVDSGQQERLYQTALKNTKPWKEKRRICRNYTSACVHGVRDGHLDFIYVDARHDFKGVYEDLVNWWPKLRVGGILAGHDYVTQDDGPKQGNQDWTINFDGTKDWTRTVVKGAVDKFAGEVCRQLTISYRESGWNSWALRK